jgi:hypothetical protein
MKANKNTLAEKFDELQNEIYESVKILLKIIKKVLLPKKNCCR